MKRAQWVKDAMSVGNDFHYLKKTPWKHNILNLLLSLALSLGLALTAVAGAVLSPWLYIPLATAAFGMLYFSVFVLIIHECSHNMFVVLGDRARAKWLNRWIGIAAATPMFTNYIHHWEEGHRYHHLHPGEPDDKQFIHTFSGAELRRNLLRLALIPGYAIFLNPSRRYDNTHQVLAGAAVFWLLFVGLSAFFLHWAVPVAAFLGFNVLQMLNLLKKSLEHGAGLEHEPDPLFRTRTYFHPLGGWISPFNINYHFEHHLNFTVPWYDLPAYHARVAALTPAALHPHVYNNSVLQHLDGTRPLYSVADRRLISGEASDLSGEASGVA